MSIWERKNNNGSVGKRKMMIGIWEGIKEDGYDGKG